MELNVVGLMNIQYAICNDVVYILEANPRASRTVPLVSKVCNIQMARLAVQCMLGKKLSQLGIKQRKIPHFGVKEAVFPFNMFPEVDPLLGPEMRSTGEVLGMANSFGLAFYKSQQAAKQELPLQGTVLITVTDEDKKNALKVAREFQKLGFRIKATEGTYKFLTAGRRQGRADSQDARGPAEYRRRDQERRDPTRDQYARWVARATHDDSYIRKAAIKYKIPYITTTAAAAAAVKGIAEARNGTAPVRSLQSYHAGIK